MADCFICFNKQESTELSNLERLTLLNIGLACGAIGAWYFRPVQANLTQYNALFRKPWLRHPITLIAFGCFFYGGMQLPGKVFPKFTKSKFEGVTHSYYTSS
jgi:hypothetical protein